MKVKMLQGVTTWLVGTPPVAEAITMKVNESILETTNIRPAYAYWRLQRFGLLLTTIITFLLLGTEPLRAWLCHGLGCVLPPDETLASKSYGEWSVAYWQWLFALPRDRNPSFDGIDSLNGGNGQSGPVWFLADNGGHVVVRNCTLPAYKAVFVPVLLGECSTLEAPPMGDPDTNKLSACIKSIPRRDYCGELRIRWRIHHEPGGVS